MFWQFGRHRLCWQGKPLTMGILNVTPDSFSDSYPTPEAAMKQARHLVDGGATIIDIGGESTRPGSTGIGTEEELARILPVIRALRKAYDIPLSVDTQKPQVAKAAIDEGVDIVNHVSASLDYEAMLPVIADSDVGYVAMHMRERPKSMQRNPSYDEPVKEVTEALLKVGKAAKKLGIASERLIFDPGIGFGKRLEHNRALMKNLSAMCSQLERPLLLGLSRKSWLEHLLGPEIDAGDERDAHTAIATVLLNNPNVLVHRVHNVGLINRALDLAQFLARESD